MRFEKWQAAGNAYLVIERGDLSTALTAARVQRICHPDLGAGSDGILVLDAIEPGHARVQILNPDGGEAEFSGNGSRIAAAYVSGRDGRVDVVLETLKGTVSGTVDGGSVTIDAGAATLEGPDHRPGGGDPPAPLYQFVSLGNPHCVIESEGVDGLDLAAVGAPIERHAGSRTARTSSSTGRSAATTSACASGSGAPARRSRRAPDRVRPRSPRSLPGAPRARSRCTPTAAC